MSIDSRVVSLTFDNKQFEEAVKQTLSSLQSLDKALDEVNSGKSLSGISEAAKSVDLSNIESGVDRINSKFSVMGVAGATAVAKLTSGVMNLGKSLAKTATNSLLNGGLTRALNIEQAEFLFEGLGVNVQKAMTSASNAVDQTAYSLDAAAKVGASLSASGVKAGDELENALRGVAGMAAVTGSDFQSIGDIFATVAGNGRLMSQELLQFSSRGLNAAAVMTKFGEYAGKTEAEIRELVTEGKVSFKQFSDAMSEAFGDQATKANETFTGALSNMKTALARIGANFFGGVANSFYVIPDESVGALENLRKIFVALMPVINNVNKALTPFIIAINTKLTSATDKLVSMLGSLEKITNKFSNRSDGIKEFIKSFSDIKGLDGIFERIKEDGKLTTETLQMFTDKGINMASILGKAMGKSEKQIRKMVENGKLDFETFHTALNDTFGKLWSEKHFSGFIETLKGGAKSVKEFASSGETLSKVKDIFTGLASAFKILVNVGKAIFTILKPIASIFLSIAAAIGNFITGVSKATSASDGFFSVLDKVASSLESFSSKVYTIGTFIGDGLAAGFDKVVSAIGKILGFLGKATSGFTGLTAAITGAGLLNAIMALNFQITKFKFIFKNITDLFNGFKNWANTIGAIGAIPRDIDAILTAAKRSLYAFSNDLQAKALLEIAAAVFLLAKGLAILAGLDSKSLTQGLEAISILLMEVSGAMIGFMKVTSKMSLAVKSLASLGIVMIEIAAAVLILAKAIKTISELDTGELVRGLSGVTIMLGAIAAFAITISKFGGKVNVSTGIAMIAMAAALLIMVEAVEKIANIDPNGLVQGLEGIIVILGAIMSFAVGINQLGGKVSLKTAVAIIGIAAAISIMATAVTEIAKLNPKELATGLGGIVALMSAIFGLSVGIGKLGGSGLISAGVGMVAMAKAIEMLVPSLQTLGSMKLENLGKGIGTIAAALILMAGASLLVSAAGAVGILLMATAISMLGSAIIRIGSVDIVTIAKGLGTIAVSLAIFGAAALVLTPVIPAMIALGAAFIVLSAGVAILGAGLITVGAGLTAISAGLMSFASVGLSAVTIFGEVFNKILTTIVNAIPSVIAALAQGLISFVQTIAESANQILPYITQIIGMIVTAITENVPKLIEAGILLLTEFLGGIRDSIHEVATLAAEIIVKFIDAMSEKQSEMIDAGMNLMISLINGLADGVRNNAEAIRDAVINLCEAILEAFMTFFGIASPSKVMETQGNNLILGLINGIKKNVGKVLTAFMNGIKKVPSKITQKVSDFIKSGKNLMQGLLDGIGDKKEKIKEKFTAGIDLVKKKITSTTLFKTGKNLMQGFVNGLNALKDKVTSFWTWLCDKASKIVEKKNEMHSPSKLYYRYGKNIMKGLVNGLDDYKSKPLSVLSTMSDKMSGVLNTDMSPTITPVVDMSEIQNGINSIGNLQNSFNSAIGDVSLDIPSNPINPNTDVVKAINKLRKDIENINNTTYNVNGITYDDGSNITSAVETLVRATKVEGRI